MARQAGKLDLVTVTPYPQGTTTESIRSKHQHPTSPPILRIKTLFLEAVEMCQTMNGKSHNLLTAVLDPRGTMDRLLHPTPSATLPYGRVTKT